MSPSPKVCGVCGRPLDYIHRSDGEEGYGHANEVFGSKDLDHLPIPVDPTEIEAAPVCDFCFAAMPPHPQQWTVVTKPFVIGVGDVAQSMSALWAACPDCKYLIAEGHWRPLRERVVNEMIRRHSETDHLLIAGWRKALELMYDKVRENLVSIRPSSLADLADDYAAPEEGS